MSPSPIAEAGPSTPPTIAFASDPGLAPKLRLPAPGNELRRVEVGQSSIDQEIGSALASAQIPGSAMYSSYGSADHFNPRRSVRQLAQTGPTGSQIFSGTSSWEPQVEHGGTW